MDSDLDVDDVDLSGIQEELELGDELDEEDLLLPSTSITSPKKHKKSKKHKHHKKKKTPPDGDLGATPPIKLKFKIGGQMMGTKSINVNPPGGVEELDDPLLFLNPGGSFFSQAWSIKKEETVVQDDIFHTKRSDDSTSDDERQWLDALEAGTLDDSGAVKKKEKDPSLLTTRQKALLHGRQDNQLLELPSGYRVPELTEEQIQRRQLRAKKRREQAYEKREKAKKQTVERLLKKQDTKTKGLKFRGNRRSRVPAFRYINKADCITLSTPLGYSFPFPSQKIKPAPAVKRCGAPGCGNPKKYNCSKTGIPLCSLECYKKNLSRYPTVSVTS